MDVKVPLALNTELNQPIDKTNWLINSLVFQWICELIKLFNQYGFNDNIPHLHHRICINIIDAIYNDNYKIDKKQHQQQKDNELNNMYRMQDPGSLHVGVNGQGSIKCLIFFHLSLLLTSLVFNISLLRFSLSVSISLCVSDT